MKPIASFLIILTFFTSCSPSQVTMRKEDCRNLNWEELGNIEGAKGLSVEMLDYHIKRCPPKLESASRSQYIKGHQNGVRRYCTYRTGFILGEVGDPIPKLCEALSYREFHKGFRDGQIAATK